MLTTSHDMATISSSFTCVTIFSATAGSRVDAFFLATLYAFPARRKSSGYVHIFSLPSTARPIDARLDRQHHALTHGPLPRLMCIWRFMRSRADAVTDRVRRLPRISALGNARPHQAIQIGKTRPVTRMIDGFVEHLQE